MENDRVLPDEAEVRARWSPSPWPPDDGEAWHVPGYSPSGRSTPVAIRSPSRVRHCWSSQNGGTHPPSIFARNPGGFPSSVVSGTHETTRRSVPVLMTVSPYGYSTRPGSPRWVRRFGSTSGSKESISHASVTDGSPGERTSRLPASSIPNRERRRPVRVRSGTRPGGPRRFRLAVSTGSQRGVE